MTVVTFFDLALSLYFHIKENTHGNKIRVEFKKVFA